MKSTKVTIMIIATVVICGAFVSSARADCGLSARRNLAGLSLPTTSAATHPMMPNASAQEDSDSDSIVGLWHAIFKDSGGQFFDEGYDQFHSDGTEVLNDIPNPAFGNVCLGVYARNGRGEPWSSYWTFNGRALAQAAATDTGCRPRPVTEVEMADIADIIGDEGLIHIQALNALHAAPLISTYRLTIT